MLVASADLGAVRYANRAVERLLGISPTVIRRAPRSLLSAVHPEDQATVHALLDAASSSSSEARVRFARAEGAVRHVRLRLVRSGDATGTVAIIASDDTVRSELGRLAEQVASGGAALERALRELAVRDVGSPDEQRTELPPDAQGDGAAVDRTAFERRLGTLSRREREVLELLVQGKSTAQIASALGIRPSTVGVHRATLLRKVGVKSIVALLRRLVFAVAPRRSL